MTPIEKLAAEHAALMVAVSRHRTKIDAAYEAADSAKEFSDLPVRNGIYQVDFERDAWRYPAVAVAMEELERLLEDDGFYWAESRVRDIELILGMGFNPQGLLPFPGLVPETNPSVDGFLRNGCV